MLRSLMDIARYFSTIHARAWQSGRKQVVCNETKLINKSRAVTRLDVISLRKWQITHDFWYRLCYIFITQLLITTEKDSTPYPLPVGEEQTDTPINHLNQGEVPPRPSKRPFSDEEFWKELLGGKEKKSKEQNLKELGFWNLICLALIWYQKRLTGKPISLFW